MPDQNDAVRPAPQQYGFFTRLYRRFKRDRHSISSQDLEADAAADSKHFEETLKWLNSQTTMPGDRKKRYEIFDTMSSFDLVQSVLDVYADESTQKDYDKGKSVWVEGGNEAMRTAANVCFENTLMEDRVNGIAWRMCQKGDEFERLIYHTGKGVLGWRYADPARVHRADDKYSRLVGFKEDGEAFRQKKSPVSWPWDYVHFRMLGRSDYTGYGDSVLAPMFRPWRQLVLSEDAVLMYRLRRTPDRNLVMVDIGDQEEADSVKTLNDFRKRFRKTEFIDPASSQYQKAYNPITPMEDIYLPSRGADDSTRVETLSGSGDVGQLFDIDYLRQKFAGAAKVPPAYLGFAGEIAAKSLLSQQDVRFARTVKRVQKAVIYGIRNLLDIHFALLEDAQGDKFNSDYLVQMSPISYLDEFERLELINLRVGVMTSLSALGETMRIDPRVWATYILISYGKLPEELVLKLVSKMPSAPAAGGGGGADFVPTPAGPVEPATDVGEPTVVGVPTNGEPAQPEAPVNSSEAVRRRHLGRIEEVYRLPKGSVSDPIGKGGFGTISESERLIMAKMMHTSPQLRKIVGDLASYGRECNDHQKDYSSWFRKPKYMTEDKKIIVFTDDAKNTDEARSLEEDLKALQTKKAAA